MTIIRQLATAAALLLASQANALEIVYSKHRDAESFKRISEHLTGIENPGRYAIARTDADSRDGHYISLKVESGDTAAAYRSVRISTIKPGALKPEQTTVPFDAGKKRYFLIGITGPSWESQDALPTAWKVEFLDANGAALASAQSFLWSPRE